MQTRKRAKPVKFGKNTSAKEEKKDVTKEVEEKKEVKDVKEVKEPVQEEPQESILSDKLPAAPPIETESSTPASEPSAPAADQTSQATLSATPPATVETSTTQLSPAPPSTPPSEPSEISPTPNTNEVATTTQPNTSDSPVTVQEVPTTTQDLSPAPATLANEDLLEDDSGKKHLVRYFFIIALIAFLVGIAFFAGTFYAVQKKSFSLPVSLPAGVPGFTHAKPTPTTAPASPTVAVSPTVAPVTPLEMSTNTIKVLNGSSIPGEAAKVKEQLTTAGFKVISAGNADNQDYQNTQISFKNTVSEGYIDKLKEELSKSFEIGTVSKLPPSAAVDADVTITIGSTPAK